MKNIYINENTIKEETRDNLKTVLKIHQKFHKSQITISDIEHLKKSCISTFNNLELTEIDNNKIYYIKQISGGRGKPRTFEIKEFDINYYLPFFENNLTEESLTRFKKETETMFCISENWYFFHIG